MIIHSKQRFCIVTFTFLFLFTGIGTAQYTWTVRNSGTDAGLQGVAWGNGQFVAVGTSGTILTSPDGIEWTAQNSGTENGLNSVVWGENGYVAVGNNNTILFSTDGTDWEVCTEGIPSDKEKHFYSVTCGNGRYVAVSRQNLTLYSNEGVEWNPVTFGGPFEEEILAYGVNYAAGRFVAVGSNGQAVFTSIDGIVWDLSFVSGFGPMESPTFNSVTYGKGMFVAVGNGYVIASQDGEEWSLHHSVSIGNPFITCRDSIFLMICHGIQASSDLTEWTQTTIPVEAKQYGMTSIAFNDSIYVSVGSQGTILTSETGMTTSIQQETHFEKTTGSKLKSVGGTLRIPLLSRKAGQSTNVKLYNISGRRVKLANIRHSEGELRIPVSHLAPGVYMLKMDGEGEEIRMPVVIRD